MRNLIVYILPILLLFCGEQESTSVSTILDSKNEIKKNLKLEEQTIFESKDEYVFSAIAYTSQMDLFAFERNKGLIIKFDEFGKIIKSVGGIGKGPNEFITDINTGLVICDDYYLIAYDWSQARYSLYDMELNLIKIVQIKGVPYEVACGKSGEIIILYSSTSDSEILTLRGQKINTIKFSNDLNNSINSIKHVLFRNERYFLGYYFQPIIKIYDSKNKKTKTITLEYRKGINTERINTAIRSVSKSQDVHFFYNDNNIESPINERKKGIVLDSLGRYKLTYSIPNRVNYYELIGNEYLIAIEDSLRIIKSYRYFIDE